jgi:hypothetical protein
LEIDAAKKIFRRRFRAKTGNIWGNVGGTFAEVPGKHKVLQKSSESAAMGRWQYYLHNNIDGKTIGWYDYEDGPAQVMEKIYQSNERNGGLDVRHITTGYFTYEVDFRKMTQTNTKSGTRRAIRRVPPGETPTPTPPSVIPTAAKPKPEAAAESSAEEEEDDDVIDDEVDDVAEEGVDDDATEAGDVTERDGVDVDEAETLVMGGSKETLH